MAPFLVFMLLCIFALLDCKQQSAKYDKMMTNYTKTYKHMKTISLNERKYDEKPVGLIWIDGVLTAIIHRTYYDNLH